jgi:hypothetical protein
MLGLAARRTILPPRSGRLMLRMPGVHLRPFVFGLIHFRQPGTGRGARHRRSSAIEQRHPVRDGG